jgi:hypothetical protein
MHDCSNGWPDKLMPHTCTERSHLSLTTEIIKEMEIKVVFAKYQRKTRDPALTGDALHQMTRWKHMFGRQVGFPKVDPTVALDQWRRVPLESNAGTVPDLNNGDSHESDDSEGEWQEGVCEWEGDDNGGGRARGTAANYKMA